VKLTHEERHALLYALPPALEQQRAKVRAYRLHPATDPLTIKLAEEQLAVLLRLLERLAE